MQIITVALILLKILKVIGIILLSLLLILLFLVTVILFSPVRYRMDANKKEGSLLLCKAGVSWLFIRFVNLEYRDKKLKFRFYVPFLMDKKYGYDEPSVIKDETSVNKDKTSVKKDKPGKAVKNEDFDQTPESPVGSHSANDTGSYEDFEQSSHYQYSNKGGTFAPDPDDENDSNGFFGSVAKKISGAANRISGLIRDIADRIIAIKKMPESLSKKKDIIFGFLDKRNTKYTIDYVKKLVKDIYRLIRPKKIKGKLKFGFEDPYNTGNLLALLSVLYPLYAGNLKVNPDFDNRVLAGDLKVKGRFILFPFVVMALKTFFDKRVKITIKELRKLDLSAA